jgi:hypothetical protein
VVLLLRVSPRPVLRRPARAGRGLRAQILPKSRDRERDAAVADGFDETGVDETRAVLADEAGVAAIRRPMSPTSEIASSTVMARRKSMSRAETVESAAPITVCSLRRRAAATASRTASASIGASRDSASCHRL